jgi:phosphodiesterase/alkaline phosphatase D-like protein
VTVFNRRNALLGYATWMGLKVLARQKARQAVPTVDRKTKRPNKSAIALGLASAAAVVGAVVVWKSHSPEEPA